MRLFGHGIINREGQAIGSSSPTIELLEPFLNSLNRWHGEMGPYKYVELFYKEGTGVSEFEKLIAENEALRYRLKELHEYYGDSEPIRLVMHCPVCTTQHIDKDEWVTKRHKTHLCEVCKHEWRPIDFFTVGVEKIETSDE
jgi:hypothetical protein